MYKACGDLVFPELIKKIIQDYEGESITHISGDKGGWTKFGICQLDIDPTTGHLYTESGIKNLTIEGAIPIYFNKYWLPLGCACMPKALAIEVLDWGINHGIQPAIWLLQHLILSSQNDGIFGPKTLADLKFYLQKNDITVLINYYADYRSKLYSHWGLESSQKKFLKGWLNRNESVRAWALLEAHKED